MAAPIGNWSKTPIRVVLVEDDKVTRHLLTQVIKDASSLEFLKAFPDGESLMKSIATLQADVILMDIQLPRRSGIECTRILKQKFPETQVIMFTIFADSEHLIEALKAGACGYLLKRSSAKEVVEGIEEVHQGGAPMSPGIARKMMEALHAPGGGEKADDKQSLWGLTTREYQVLGLLAKGYSAKEIASHLSLSEPTIRFHLRSVYTKLHVRTRTEAVVKFLN